MTTRLPHELGPDAGDAGDDHLPPSGFELRLADGRAFVSALGRPLAEGVVARRFRMEVPRIKFPFDVTGGADRFRDQRCLLRELELSVDAGAIARWLTELVDLTGLSDGPVQLAARPGFLELLGQHPVAGPYTAKLAVEVSDTPGGSGETLGLFLYDFRLYQPSEISAAELLHRFATQARAPLLRRDPSTGSQLSVDALTPALRQLLVPRGFRLPQTAGVGLRRAHVLTGQLVLEFEEQALPASPPIAGELLAREGQRVFAEVETLIAAHKLDLARAALSDLAQAEAHPFAAERLLQLLVSDPASHDLALDLCAVLARRSPIPPAALWVEAVLRESLGGPGSEAEWLRAANAFLALAELSLAERGLFAAATAARRAAELSLRGRDDALATRAYALWESAVPNDVDALLGLAQIAERRGDLVTAMGALRRVSAFAQDGQVSARAHARLGRLLLDKTDDVARARLHLDQALRQNPDDLESVLALARSCERSGEWVRAVRLHDRAAQVARACGELGLAAELLAAEAVLWEEQLARPENALLRYRQAIALEPPGAVRRVLFAAVARLCQRLGLRADALEAQRAVAQASAPGRPRAEALLAEARLLGMEATARGAAALACERALDEDPSYFPAAEELIALRRLGAVGPLREALSRAATLAEPAPRVALLIERGELELSDPALPTGTARATFAAALATAAEWPEALADAWALALARLAAAAERDADFAGAAAALASLAGAAKSAEDRATWLRQLAEVAARIADPGVARAVLRQAAEGADAPLPVLLRLLELERHQGLIAAEVPLALRLAGLAQAEGQPDLALSVLAEQLERVVHQDEVNAVRPLLALAQELAPRDAHLRESAVRLFRLAGDLEALRPALVAYLETAEARPPQRQLDLWRELAEVSLAVGQRREAIAAYEVVRSLNADDQDSAEALIDLYAMEGRGTEQANALRELSDLMWRAGDVRGAAARLLALAALAAPAAALAHLQRAVALDPSPNTLRALAAFTEASGATALAVDALEALAQVEEGPSAQALALRRAAFLSLDGVRALELALRVHAVDPEDAFGQVAAAGAALADGAASPALTLSEAALAQPTAALDEPVRDYAAAVALAAAQMLLDAEAEDRALQRLQARFPDELGYAEQRIDLLRRTWAAPEAIAAALLPVAGRLAPELAADHLQHLGGLWQAGGEAETAAVVYRAALDRLPNSGPALLGLWSVLPETGPEDIAERPRLRSRLLAHPRLPDLLGAAARGRLWAEEARAVAAAGTTSPETFNGELRALWQHAFDLLPTETEPARELARLHESAGDLRLAAELHLALAARQPDGDAGAALIAAVDLLAKLPAPAEAASVAEAAVTRALEKPALAALWQRAADLRRTLHEPEAELRALDQAVVLTTSSERTQLHLRRADLFLSRGDREGERVALSQALVGKAADVALLSRLKAAAEALGDDEGVADMLELMLQAKVADRVAAAELAVELGHFARDKLGALQRAEAAYRRALLFVPDHGLAREALAEILIGRGDAESVGRGLGLLVAGLGASGSATLVLATVALAERAACALDRPDVALRLLRSVGDPSFGESIPTAALSLGAELGAELLYGQGATAEALGWLTRACEQPGLAPEQMSRFGLQRVELLCDLGRDGEALAALLPLLQAPPFEAGALDQLTGLLSRGAALAAGHLEGIVDGVRAPRRAADLLALDAARRGAVDPAGAAEQLRHAQALDPSPERHRALRAALVTLGDPSALRAFHAEEIDRARAAGDADGELAAQRALVAALGALGDGASEALALGTLAQLLLDRGQRTESGAVFARLGTLRAAAGEERAALDACAEAVALGHDAALDIAEALARQLADPRVLAGLLERRLELMAMPAGSAARPEIYGELSRLYRGPLAAPELAERTLRRALAAGAAPSEDLEALIELLRQEGRAAEVAALLERCGHELAVQGDLGAAAVLLTRAAEEFEVHGDPQSALGPRREGVTLDRTPARLLALADACHGLGLEAEAASLYAELCEIDPLPPFRVLERRAESLRQSQDPQRLAAFLEDHASATATATTAAWLREAATVRHGLGDLDAELRDLRAAFDADPSQSEVFAALVARGGVSDTTGWAELLRRRASAVPAEAVTLLRSAGDLVLHAGRVAEAIDLFDEALSVAPEDALALAGRIEVATLMHQPCESWVAQLLVVLGEGRGGEGAAAEALPRAAAALLSGGLPDAAQRLLEIAPVLPAAVREGALFVALRDQVAQARGDRRGQLTARRDRLARTAPGEAPPALEALLAVVLPEDPEAVAIYRHAWDVQGVPHSTALANKLLSAFDCMSARADPEAEAAFLESLLDADLLPTSTAEDRVSWAVRAAEIRLQKLANREAAGWLFERAIDDATTSPTLLRRLLAMALPAAPRAKLLGVAAAEGEGSQRAEWLLERARLSDESLSPAEAAAAWDAVLREGSGSPGYAQALERTLTRALAEERFADAANALVAQAEVAEGGAARAQLLEKAAQIHESQLGDVSRALELFQRAAAESGDVRWFTLLAEAYDRAGRTAEAAAALAVEVARREPGERRRERQRKLGLMLARELNRPGDALIHLRAVVSADAPGGVDDPALFEALADSARAVGNDEAELLGLSRMARSTGREALTTRDLRRAALLEALGRSAEAAELWTSILEVEPANALAFAPLAGRLRERKAWRELAEQLGRHATALGAVSPGASAAPRVALLVEQGEILLSELADRKEAERVFREALALEPATPRALAALRHLVDVRGDQRELLVLLEAQLALTTEDAAAAPLALQLGEVALRLGEPQLARRGLRRALAGAAAAEPGLLAQVRPLLARVELDLGDFKEALAQAEAALDAGPLEAAPLLVVAGQAASQLGEGLRALGHFRMLLQEQPGHPEALAGLELLSHDSEAGLAGEALSQRIAHESDPSRKARALRDLGRLRETLGDPVGAESALRESVKLDPDGEDGFAQLRQLLESEGRYPELAEVLRERARGTTDEIVRAALLVEQAELLRTHLADPLRAAEAYQRSLEILPRASTSEGYAEALFALGRDELAAEHYRRALGGGGHLGEFFLLYRLGDLARRANDKAGALEQYRKSAEANPSFLPAREALIDLAEELGNGELALAALRAMVEQLDPHEFAEQVVESHLRIAELQKRALHFDAAAESLEKASELRPEDERPLQRLAALYQNGSRWVDAVRVLERVAALKSGPESAVPLTVAGEITLDKLADMERASLLFDRALQASPDQESALRRSLEMAAALGQQERLLPLADQVLAIYFGPAGAKLRPSPAWLDELFLPIAQAFEQAGRIEDAYGVLVLARERSPGDLALLDHQATLAKRSGRFGEEADLEAQLIERIVSSRPLEAATRLRILARRVLEKLDDSDRAREMLYRAAALAPARPEDRRLLADLQRQTTDPLVCGQALETYLELVRRDPTLDLVLLRVLAATAAEQDRPELSQTALSLVAALEGATVGAAPTLTPLPQSAWAIGSLAGEGGIELVLQTLAPYLEPLFPVQLARYGVSGVDRVGPGHAPELHQWVDRARESLGARPTDVYLSPSLKGVALENSHPPSLLIGAQAVQALGQGGMQWLLCQRLALSELGFTLPAKFSPKDVTTLAALATLYLTDDAPVPMADRQRLHVFLEALRRSCPEAVRQTLLGQAARTARELHAFDPHRYIASALARANRLALLVTGDLRSALAALDYLDGGDAPCGRPWELPQGKALIEWAFSEEHNALRRLALGKQPR